MDAALPLLLADPAVAVYLLVLGAAVRRCVRTYYCRRPPNDDDRANRPPPPSALPLVLSAAILAVTWTYILRFISTHVSTSSSYFDDAYKDVLRNGPRGGHYFTSTQLLTWAIVAVAWAGSEGCDAAYLLYGFLGAMGASFVLWVPALYDDDG